MRNGRQGQVLAAKCKNFHSNKRETVLPLLLMSGTLIEYPDVSANYEAKEFLAVKAEVEREFQQNNSVRSGRNRLFYLCNASALLVMVTDWAEYREPSKVATILTSVPTPRRLLASVRVGSK